MGRSGIVEKIWFSEDGTRAMVIGALLMEVDGDDFLLAGVTVDQDDANEYIASGAINRDGIKITIDMPERE